MARPVDHYPGELAKRFATVWDGGGDTIPDVFAFLEQQPQASPAEQAGVLLVDQARRWRRGFGLLVEEYLQRCPDVAADAELVLDLLGGEYHCLQARGEAMQLDSFVERFSGLSEPELREQVAQRAKLAPNAALMHTSEPDQSLERTEDSAAARPEAAADAGANSSGLPERIGRYRLVEILGEGGFGRVYLARDEELDRLVAVKVIRREPAAGAEYAKALRAEARLLAALDHSGIVPVYDTGQLEDGSSYIVSKFIEGGDLAQLIESRRPSYSDAAELAAAVADALHYAHAGGLVHRDIKPGNILLDAAGRPLVADFGLALKDEDLGKGSGLAGTPAYMSPEQARGESDMVDGRSDVFSLGVVLYELLTGRRPFQAKTREETLARIARMEAKPPRQWNSTIPPELERICLKALANRAAERYTTALDFAEDLRAYLAGESTAEGQSAADPPGSETAPPVESATSDAPASPAKKRRGLKLAIAAVFVAAVAAAVVIYVKTRDGTLVLQIDPPGAKVTVLGEDGVEITDKSGKQKLRLQVNPGGKTVRVEKEGFRVETREATITPWGEQRITFKLAPEPVGPIPPPLDKIPPETAEPVTLPDANPHEFAGTNPGDEKILALEMKFRWCPAGRFLMGSPRSEPGRRDDEKQVPVTLTNGFWLGQYEVTQAQWSALMNKSVVELQKSSGLDQPATVGPRFPVHYVDHRDATMLCGMLNRLAPKTKRLPPGWEYGLPTEAQWEWACRAMTTTATAFGDSLDKTQANIQPDRPYNSQNIFPGPARLAEVGQYKPNAWGLSDMHGNLLEWCRDYYHPHLPGGRDPEMTSENSAQKNERLLRGGTWYQWGENARSAHRTADFCRKAWYGFRLAVVRAAK